MITNSNQFEPGEISTSDYEPSYLYGPYFWEQRKPWFNRRFIPAMLRDSRVKFGLRLIKGPLIAGAKFDVEADSQDVGEFVENTVDRFWSTSAIVALRALEWGYSGSEAIYLEDDNGLVQFCELKSLSPWDVRVYTKSGWKAAVRVKDIRHHSKTGTTWLYGPKGFWHVHEREEQRWYGIPRLLGAYPAWYDKFKNGGAKDSMSLFFYKYAVTGTVVKYPPQVRKLPNGVIMDPKEEAEKIANQTRNGATICMPNERDGDGNPLWEIEYAQNSASGQELMDYHRALDKQIFEGLGIPEELIEAGQTGSGYAGRRVPAQSFFGILQELGEVLLSDVRDQIIRPLVDWNFGTNAEFKVTMKPLAAGDLEEDVMPEEEGDEAVSADSPDGAPETNPYQ